jgi:Fe-S cluster assembly protein SufD
VFASDGVVVRVPKGERQRVVIDSRWSGGMGTLAAGRVLVVVGEGAEVELTEVCRTRGEVVVLRGREIVAERGAVVRVADITENPRGVVVESRLTTQREGSSCRALFCNLSEGACRTNIKNILAEAHAESECNGVFVTSEQTHDIMMDVRHEASDCRSSELIKGMAMGTSVGSFAGCIYVAEGAQKTDASLLNRNIVLGEGARIYTKPTLEIYADDVKCGHGATVGKLDPEAIYYMRQRGLSEQMARQLQLMGFAAEVVENYGGVAAERMTAAIERILQTI